MSKLASVQLDLGVTQRLRLVKPALFEASKFIENGRVREDSIPRYKATFALTPGHPDIKAIWDAVLHCTRTDFPDLIGADGNPNPLMPVPLILGDAYAAAKPESQWRQSLKGFVVLKAGSAAVSREGNSKRPPGLGAPGPNGGMIDVPTDETRKNYEKFFFGGAECFVTVGVASFVTGSNRGVTAYLNIVASTGQGERVEAWNGGAPPSATARFGQHVGTVQPAGTPYAHPGFGQPVQPASVVAGFPGLRA